MGAALRSSQSSIDPTPAAPYGAEQVGDPRSPPTPDVVGLLDSAKTVIRWHGSDHGIRQGFRGNRMSDPGTGNGKVVVSRCMSLDGFIAGPGDSMDWISTS